MASRIGPLLSAVLADAAYLRQLELGLAAVALEAACTDVVKRLELGSTNCGFVTAALGTHKHFRLVEKSLVLLGRHALTTVEELHLGLFVGLVCVDLHAFLDAGAVDHHRLGQV